MRHLNIQRQSNVPVYLQIANQLHCMISAGQFASGECLPTIRALAGQLSLNPNTVAKAYAVLQERGAIEKFQGSGCYVSETRQRLATNELKRFLADRLAELAVEAGAVGLSLEDLMGMVEPVRTEGSPEMAEETPAVPASLWQPADSLID